MLFGPLKPLIMLPPGMKRPPGVAKLKPGMPPGLGTWFMPVPGKEILVGLGPAAKIGRLGPCARAPQKPAGPPPLAPLTKRGREELIFVKGPALFEKCGLGLLNASGSGLVGFPGDESSSSPAPADDSDRSPSASSSSGCGRSCAAVWPLTPDAAEGDETDSTDSFAGTSSSSFSSSSFSLCSSTGSTSNPAAAWRRRVIDASAAKLSAVTPFLVSSVGSARNSSNIRHIGALPRHAASTRGVSPFNSSTTFASARCSSRQRTTCKDELEESSPPSAAWMPGVAPKSIDARIAINKGVSPKMFFAATSARLCSKHDIVSETAGLGSADPTVCNKVLPSSSRFCNNVRAF
mmetsp:Transcript_108339/g.271548  ORF Transcript_108339/g.271548 Transcript_108339/m.271548 type:complete len:349 (+) Transcript_108339:30-1076(+)